MVRRRLSELQIDYIVRNVPPGAPARKKLVELGGKQQVPFLVDPERGVSMYESLDIIAYVEEHYT